MSGPYGLPLGGQRIVVAERAARLTGREIVIPGLRAHPNRLPATPSPWDREFSGPGVLSGYVLSGTIATWDHNKTVPGHLYLAQPGASAGYGALFWPSPAPPFTVTAFVDGVGLNPTAGNQSQQPYLCLGAASPAAGSTMPQVGIWVGGDGSTNCAPFSGVNGTFVNGGFTPAFGILRPHWLRLIVDASHNVTTQFSFCGLPRSFHTLQSAVASGITVGSFGFGARDLGTAYSVAVGWIRVTRP